jgi:hypothetical protein
MYFVFTVDKIKFKVLQHNSRNQVNAYCNLFLIALNKFL